jgi:hypothetical protein
VSRDHHPRSTAASSGHRHRHPRSPGQPVLDRTARDESIEFLSPRVDLFAGGPTLHDISAADGGEAAFADVDEAEAKRSRWTMVAAAAGLIALVAVGVVAAAPWEDELSVAPTVTTPPAPTVAPLATPAPGSAADADVFVVTPPGMTEAEAAALTDGYLIDPTRLPTRIAPQPSSMPGAPTTSPEGWLDLWATPGASRTNGAWFSIGWNDTDSGLLASAAIRITLDDGVGLLHVDDDGVSTLTFARSGGTATLTWFGQSDDEMIAYANGVGFGAASGPSEPDGWTPGDLVRLLHGPSNGRDLVTDFLDGRTTARARYWWGDGRYVEVATQSTDPDHVTMRPFVLSKARQDSMSGPSVSRAVGDRTVVLGSLPGEQWFGTRFTNLLEWTEGDVTVLVSGNLASAQLLALVPIIRQGTVAEWWGMGAGPADDGELDVPDANLSDMLGFGTLAGDRQWLVELDPVLQRALVSAPAGPDGLSFWIDLALGPCATASNADTTIAACIRSAADGQETMRVTTSAGDLDVHLTAVDPNAQHTVAIAQFDAPGSFQVEIIASDGGAIPALTIGPAGNE